MAITVLKKGSRGEEVKRLQENLGIYFGKNSLYADGIYGALTEDLVKVLQKELGLVCDGVAGPKTLEALSNKIGGVHLAKSSRKIKEIIVHCSATAEGKNVTVSDITRWHKDRGYKTIGYHYVIDLQGAIKEGRSVNMIGAHCEGRNTYSIGVCYVGGCDSSGKKAKDTRTSAQKESLRKVVQELIDIYHLTPAQVHGHYEYANKACPSFKIEELRKTLK